MRSETVGFRLLRCGQNVDHFYSKPRLRPSRPGKAAPKISARRLFVHECRCMAAPARRAGDSKCVIKISDKGGDASNDPDMVDSAQSRSGCWSPRVPARPRGRPITILGPVGPSRRGLRSLALVPCAVLALRPEISSLSGAARRSGRVSGLCREAARDAAVSTCCCRRMNRDFCLRGCASDWRGASGLALPDFESYRTAHSKAGFSRLLDQLGLPQPPTRIVKSGDELRDADPLSVRDQDVGRYREPRHLVCAQRGRSRKRAARSRALATRSPTKCWCRISSRARPRRRSRCFAADDCSAFMPTGRSPPVSAAAKRSSKACSRPAVRAYLARIGRATRLARRAVGRLSSCPTTTRTPLLIDCNPRLVEPMNAYRCRRRSGRIVAACLARRNAGGVAGEPRGRAARIWRCRRCWDALRAAARGATSCGSAGVSRPAADLTPAAAKN